MSFGWPDYQVFSKQLLVLAERVESRTIARATGTECFRLRGKIEGNLGIDD